MPGFQPCIAVLGPTAVGKTETALRLAAEFKGEIVSCDSVQIYRGLDIGSAKPAEAERKSITHHGLDLFLPDFQIDVGIYKNQAESSISDILNRDRLPVITGGTGMYFNALYFGLFNGPSRDNRIRADLEDRAEREGVFRLYRELESIDNASARHILPNDKRRIVRALEVYYKTGIPISRLQEHNVKLELNWFLLGLNMDRELLYQRIEKRVDRMIEQGLIEETRALMASYGRDAYALGAIGYRHARDYIEGRSSMEEMISSLKLDTRHYAKRQIIWFRKIPNIQWFDPFDTVGMTEAVSRFLENGRAGAVK